MSYEVTESGFKNGVKYYAKSFNRFLIGLINEGIYYKYGDRFKVSPSSGMTVIVGTGYAWFDQSYTFLESAISITLDASSIQQSRIDAIVIETGDEKNVINVVKGTPAISPNKPTLKSNQHVIAYVTVGANVSAITASMINNRAGKSDAPYITSAVDSVDASTLLDQLDAEIKEWLADVKSITTDDSTLSVMAKRIKTIEDAIGESTAKMQDMQAEIDKKANKATVSGNLTIYDDGTRIYMNTGTFSPTEGQTSFKFKTHAELCALLGISSSVSVYSIQVYASNGDSAANGSHWALPQLDPYNKVWYIPAESRFGSGTTVRVAYTLRYNPAIK